MQTNIHISIPCLDAVKAETVGSLLTWQSRTKLSHSISIQQNTYIHQARNKAVWEAVNQRATHLMFIDSDIVFPVDAIETLLKRDKDIVGGLYFGRIEPYPVFKNKHPSKDALINPTAIPAIALSEVEAVGTGFMLINMDVFKKMMPPFFFHASPKEFGMIEAPFPNNELGEDVVFCQKAKKNGFSIWLDSTIPLQHIGSHNYSRQDFDAMSIDK